MFMFRASAFLKELKRLAPDMLGACRRAYKGLKRDWDFLRLDAKAFSACPADSIDYAIMEKTDAAAVIRLMRGGMTSAPGRLSGRCFRGRKR